MKIGLDSVASEQAEAARPDPDPVVVTTPEQLTAQDIIVALQELAGWDIIVAPQEFAGPDIIVALQELTGLNIISTPEYLTDYNFIATPKQLLGLEIVAATGQFLDQDIAAAPWELPYPDNVPAPGRLTDQGIVATPRQVTGPYIVATPVRPMTLPTTSEITVHSNECSLLDISSSLDLEASSVLEISPLLEALNMLSTPPGHTTNQMAPVPYDAPSSPPPPPKRTRTSPSNDRRRLPRMYALEQCTTRHLVMQKNIRSSRCQQDVLKVARPAVQPRSDLSDGQKSTARSAHWGGKHDGSGTARTSCGFRLSVAEKTTEGTWTHGKTTASNGPFHHHRRRTQATHPRATTRNLSKFANHSSCPRWAFERTPTRQ
ncbi:uncharacterized protein LOC119107659 isoform X2 [Pollicipes pollicipes]|nr:uncharacterized protein LOC119107147 isoform X2 [Pollicipes pollicipes]XP_037087073.1 uncharacterized protein LOC119107659 isoform X2 [Pollicipes pollicipes]